MTASSPEIDPRLVQALPGVGGAIRDFGRRLSHGDLGSLPVVFGLLAVVVYFQIRNDRFLTAGNLTNLSLQMVGTGIISVGVVLVLLLGEIDLSVGAVSGFAAACMAVLAVKHDWSAPLAILVGVLAGTVVGLVQGLWVSYFRVPAFLVTLAGLLAWQGALLRVLGRTGSVNITNRGILRLSATFYGPVITWIVIGVLLAAIVAATAWTRRRRTTAGLPVPPIMQPLAKVVVAAVVLVGAAIVFNRDRGLPLALVIFLSLVILVDLLLLRTRFGRHIYAVGGNVEAARRAGIQVRRLRVIVFMMASTFAAMGGVMEASRNRSVAKGAGDNDFLLYAIAGAVIGGTSLFGGRGRATSALLGAIVIGSIQNGMTLLQFESDLKFIITGSVLLVAATIDAVSRRGRNAAGVA